MGEQDFKKQRQAASGNITGKGNKTLSLSQLVERLQINQGWGNGRNTDNNNTTAACNAQTARSATEPT